MEFAGFIIPAALVCHKKELSKWDSREGVSFSKGVLSDKTSFV